MDKSLTYWEEIRRSHLHESSSLMGQLGMVLTQQYWAIVFLEEVKARAEELFESTAMCS